MDGQSSPITWLGFGCSSALTRTVVHFFPSSGSVSAPYPATVKLTVLAPDWGEKRVVLEGARLSQPDGVRLEDAFPMLAEPRSGWFCIIVEVSTIEPKVDLAASQCVIELAGKGKSVRFFPRRLSGLTEAAGNDDVLGSLPGLLVRDPALTSSVVVVNAEAQIFEPKLELPGTGGSAAVLIPGLAAVAAQSVAEFGLSDTTAGSAATLGSLMQALGAEDPATHAIATGTLRQQLISKWVDAQEKAVAFFVVYREALNKRPVAVVEF